MHQIIFQKYYSDKKIYQKIDTQIDKCGSDYLFIDLGWPYDVTNNFFKKINKEIFKFLYSNNFNIISLKDKMENKQKFKRL